MGLFDLGVDWSAVEAPAFLDIPAGIYEAELIAIEPYEKDGKKSFTFDYQITEDEANDGRFIGKTKREFKHYTDENGTVDSQGLGYLKARLIDLGAPADADLSDLDAESLIGVTIALTLKKRGEYVNVSKVVRMGAAPATAKAAPAKAAPAKAAEKEEDEDNPFA